MRILVNSEPLQFSLEKVTPLAEVLDSVAEWAARSDLYIIDYNIEHAPGYSESHPPASDNIELLDVIIGTRVELIVAQLTGLDEYVNKMGTFLAGHYSENTQLSEQDKKDMADGLQYIQDALTALEPHLPEAGEELEGAMLSLKSSNDSMHKISALAIIKNRTALWLKQAQFAMLTDEERGAERVKFFEFLEQSDSVLEDIASQITMGNESRALAQLSDLIERFSAGLAILNAENPGGKNQDLNEFVKLLAELAAALDANDMVTAADIVDFDLRDGVEKLKALR